MMDKEDKDIQKKNLHIKGALGDTSKHKVLGADLNIERSSCPESIEKPKDEGKGEPYSKPGRSKTQEFSAFLTF
jgi:hypothetical protein